MPGSKRSAAVRGVVLALAGLGLLAAAGRAAAQQPAVADAAKQQDWAAVQELLRSGADVNLTQGDGATALHWAAYWNDSAALQLLLASGAVADAANDLGVTPLWLAANNGDAAVVEALLAGGADPNLALPSGETVLMTASRTGDTEVVRALLVAGADPHAAEGAHRQTALMWAVAQQHADVVRLLLESGARVDDRSLSYPQVVSSSGNADPSGVFEVQQGGYNAPAVRRTPGRPRVGAPAGRGRRQRGRGGGQRHDAAGGGRPQRPRRAGGVPARRGRGPGCGRCGLFRVARGRTARRPCAGPGAAGPWRRSRRRSDPRQPGAPGQRRLAAPAPHDRRHAVLDGRLVPRAGHHARAGGARRRSAGVRRRRVGGLLPPFGAATRGVASGWCGHPRRWSSKTRPTAWRWRSTLASTSTVAGRTATRRCTWLSAQRLDRVIAALAARGADLDARNGEWRHATRPGAGQREAARRGRGPATARVTLLRSLGATDPSGAPAAAR